MNGFGKDVGDATENRLNVVSGRLLDIACPRWVRARGILFSHHLKLNLA